MTDNNNKKSSYKSSRETVSKAAVAEDHRLPVFSQLALLGLLLVFLLSGALLPRGQNNSSVNSAVATFDDNPDYGEAVRDFSGGTTADSFSNLVLAARSAYVLDLNNRNVLYAKDAMSIRPIASITKLMTALLAHEILTEEEIITIGDTAVRQASASGLAAENSFRRQTLSDLMLLASANDGAYALAREAGERLDLKDGPAAFVRAMNLRAEELGLLDTTFLNPTGLDISETEAGAFSSARDVAHLMTYLVLNEPDLLSGTARETLRVPRVDGGSIEVQNTNYYIDEIPGLIGSKTGFTDLAGGNLAVAYNAGLNRPVVVVVIGSTYFERFTDALKLIKAANQSILNVAD